MHVISISITKKWSGQGLLRSKLFLNVIYTVERYREMPLALFFFFSLVLSHFFGTFA